MIILSSHYHFLYTFISSKQKSCCCNCVTMSININICAYGINCIVLCIIDEYNCSNKLFYYSFMYTCILYDVQLDAMKKEGKHKNINEVIGEMNIHYRKVSFLNLCMDDFSFVMTNINSKIIFAYCVTISINQVITSLYTTIRIIGIIIVSKKENKQRIYYLHHLLIDVYNTALIILFYAVL